MIIDSHTHIGKSGKLNIPVAVLIKAMDNYNISFALVSSISACEFDTFHTPLPNAASQIAANNETLDAIKKHPNRLKGLFWLRPYAEGYTSEIKNFLVANKPFFKGLKAHPYYSKTPFNSDSYIPYLELARELNLPISVHSAWDEWSHPYHIVEQAKKFPDITFIMVHMGLYGADEEAIEAIRSVPNILGDTTWIKKKVLKKALKALPPEKILFGSDSAIEGEDTYKRSQPIIETINEKCSPKDAALILSENCRRIFSL